jgi:hypothetical protein
MQVLFYVVLFCMLLEPIYANCKYKDCDDDKCRLGNCEITFSYIDCASGVHHSQWRTCRDGGPWCREQCNGDCLSNGYKIWWVDGCVDPPAIVIQGLECFGCPPKKKKQDADGDGYCVEVVVDDGSQDDSCNSDLQTATTILNRAVTMCIPGCTKLGLVLTISVMCVRTGSIMTATEQRMGRIQGARSAASRPS